MPRPETPLVRSLTNETAYRLRRAPFTYDTIGVTGPDDGHSLGDGFHHLTRTAVIGHGAEAFHTAAADLLSWQIQLRAGLGVRSSDQVIRSGSVALLTVGVGPVTTIVAPVRVVGVDTSADRAAFTYGTLPGHPESGEERFDVSLHETGAVRFTITAVSRPQSRWARLAGPLGCGLQSWVTDRYLATLVVH
ncbi:DUF1990 family protein [Williamsia sterculiae]|uniref:Uncharacterized protein, UPF0548 family n=1 Tax=Williamsia sterculiae TaxID=1344003 RepID=A0A1N7HAG9_9NOCA|nr:DUF1990 domain-containing protein [Williamsia sterculiae]SIS21700.1 Uncharacterized protein, UPF0548 family [Williamsia sterculiae]